MAQGHTQVSSSCCVLGKRGRRAGSGKAAVRWVLGFKHGRGERAQVQQDVGTPTRAVPLALLQLQHAQAMPVKAAQYYMKQPALPCSTLMCRSLFPPSLCPSIVAHHSCRGSRRTGSSAAWCR